MCKKFQRKMEGTHNLKAPKDAAADCCGAGFGTIYRFSMKYGVV